MASGESPAPFVVTGNVAGNRDGAIGMWESRLSFAIGFLLSAGSSIAVAETGIQAGQPLGVSVVGGVDHVDDDAALWAPDAPNASVRAVENLAREQAGSLVRENGDRRSLFISLSAFVDKVAAEGAAAQVPGVSLADLAAKPVDLQAGDVSIPADPEIGLDTAATVAHGPEPVPEAISYIPSDSAPMVVVAEQVEPSEQNGSAELASPEPVPEAISYIPGDSAPMVVVAEQVEPSEQSGSAELASPEPVRAAISYIPSESAPMLRAHPLAAVAEQVEPTEQIENVEQAKALEPSVAIVAASSAPLAGEQREAAGPVISARSAEEGVPSVSLVQYISHADTNSVELASDLAKFDIKSDKLQLFDAVRNALNKHPAIVESLSRLDGQQEQVNVARAGYWPQLSSGLNTGYRHSTGSSEEAFTVSASQMIYDFGKVSSSVDAAARGVDREEAGVLLAAEDLIRETAQAFIEARRYEVLLKLATEQVDAIAELEALAAKRSALGASSVSDQMQARSRRDSARATQLQIQAQRDQWYRTLENLTGSREQLTLDDRYPEPLERLCPRLPENFDSAPGVVIAEAERAEAEAAIRRARAEQRPTLSLNADFEHYLNRDSVRGQQLDDQELVVSLNLTSNLFQGGALSARRRAAEYAMETASAARDRTLLELSRLYRGTRDRSGSLTASLALQDERYDSIVKTQELYRHQYLSLGTRTLLDILNTEQEIFQSQLDKQNTLFDLRSLQIDCLYSVGGLRETFRTGEALDRRLSSRSAEGRS